MKKQIGIRCSVLGAAAGVALLLATGCGKQESTTGESNKPMNSPASEPSKPAETPKAAVQPAQPVVATNAAAATEVLHSPKAAAELQKAATQLTTAATQAQAAATLATQQVVTAAAAQTNAATAISTNQVSALIEKAKSYVTDEKYKDALSTLQQLSSTKLSDEQQKMVDSLKEKIETALANSAGSNAASALNSLLGGKK